MSAYDENLHFRGRVGGKSGVKTFLYRGRFTGVKLILEPSGDAGFSQENYGRNSQEVWEDFS